MRIDCKGYMKLCIWQELPVSNFELLKFLWSRSHLNILKENQSVPLGSLTLDADVDVRHQDFLTIDPTRREFANVRLSIIFLIMLLAVCYFQFLSAMGRMHEWRHCSSLWLIGSSTGVSVPSDDSSFLSLSGSFHALWVSLYLYFCSSFLGLMVVTSAHSCRYSLVQQVAS